MDREARAKQWAAIAVQYHQKAIGKGIDIPFPDLCFCIGHPHKHGEAPGRRLHFPDGSTKETQTTCPVINKKTQALRVKALGEALGAADAS